MFQSQPFACLAESHWKSKTNKTHVTMLLHGETPGRLEHWRGPQRPRTGWDAGFPLALLQLHTWSKSVRGPAGQSRHLTQMIREAFLEGLFAKEGADTGSPKGGTGAGKSGELLAGLGLGV